MRVARGDVTELESRIGPRGSTQITSENRALVQNWLCAQGVPSARAKQMKISTLYKAYNRPRYLAAILAHLDNTETADELAEKAERTDAAAERAGIDARVGPDGAIVLSTPAPRKPAQADMLHAPRLTAIPESMEPAPMMPASTSDNAADMKLAAAAEALKAAAALAKTHEALLSRLETLGIGGIGGADVGALASPSVTTHGAGSVPGTELVKAGDVFEGIGGEMLVPKFVERGEHVPDVDISYAFDAQTTLAILLGFAHNRRVLISGRHGTGKSSHVEQVAARLNWPFFRLNLDGHIARTDLIGRDAIVLDDGKQITEFREGILPWAMQQPVALCFDEYDAGRPDVLFVIQRVLEASGRLTIAEQNRVIEPDAGFRIFGTANTIGLGDASGLYHGTNAMNAAQMDRWSVTVRLDYLPSKHEERIVSGKCPGLDKKIIQAMVKTATATRALFAANKISTVMSPRTVIVWAENTQILSGDHDSAFALSFLNKCDDAEIENVRTCYQEAFSA